MLRKKQLAVNQWNPSWTWSILPFNNNTELPCKNSTVSLALTLSQQVLTGWPIFTFYFISFVPFDFYGDRRDQFPCLNHQSCCLKQQGCLAFSWSGLEHSGIPKQSFAASIVRSLSLFVMWLLPSYMLEQYISQQNTEWRAHTPSSSISVSRINKCQEFSFSVVLEDLHFFLFPYVCYPRQWPSTWFRIPSSLHRSLVSPGIKMIVGQIIIQTLLPLIFSRSPVTVEVCLSVYLP